MNTVHVLCVCVKRYSSSLIDHLRYHSTGDNKIDGVGHAGLDYERLLLKEI